MSEWVKRNLGDLISIKGGYSYKGDFIGKGETLLLGMGCVSFNDIFLDSGARRYSGEVPDAFVVKPGDIVLATRQQSDNMPILGAPAFIPDRLKNKRVIVGTNLYKIENHSEVDNKYLFWILRSENYRSHIDSCAKGSTVKMITKDAVESFEFLCPAKDEEVKISALLWSITEKIDLLHRQNKTLEAMAETLFRQWFVEGAGEWESGKVSDLIDVLSGFAFKSTSFVENGIYRLMTIKAVQDGYLETNNADRIAEIPANMPSYCNLQEGDILLSLTGNVGRCCLVDDEKLLLNQRVAKLRPKNERDHAFAYVMFRQMSMRSMLEEMAKGTAQANLSPVEMASMAIQIPPDDVLSEFSLAATPTLKKLLFNKREIKTLEKIRDSLLPKLMSGEVRVA